MQRGWDFAQWKRLEALEGAQWNQGFRLEERSGQSQGVAAHDVACCARIDASCPSGFLSRRQPQGFQSILNLYAPSLSAIFSKLSVLEPLGWPKPKSLHICVTHSHETKIVTSWHPVQRTTQELLSFCRSPCPNALSCPSRSCNSVSLTRLVPLPADTDRVHVE